jgi:hypothetical protein
MLPLLNLPKQKTRQPGSGATDNRAGHAALFEAGWEARNQNSLPHRPPALISHMRKQYFTSMHEPEQIPASTPTNILFSQCSVYELQTLFQQLIPQRCIGSASQTLSHRQNPHFLARTINRSQKLLNPHQKSTYKAHCFW